MGIVLAFAAAFVIAVSVLGQVYLKDRLLETPLDASVQRTLEGDAVVAGETETVRVTRSSSVDPARSDGSIASWRRSTCTVITSGATPDCLSSSESDGRLLRATLDDVATDRRTGAAVNDPANLPPDALPHEGQVERWPADAQKKSYLYWYEPAATGIETTFDRTDRVDGLLCYVYVADLDSLRTSAPDGQFAGYLGGTVELWVEPLTGTIVRERDDLSPTAGKVSRLTVESTADNVKTLTGEAADLRDRVRLLTHTLPLVGYAVGLVLLAAAFALLLLGRREDARGKHSAPRPSLPADHV
ncbi:porin PorA family protein [Nocardioides conyzicola]|uniref:DUF3068 domain-containing protein n=1 Tax=Nocardioides conyzicola TaxID=1651781 RepID=A0ABP8Y675_9ACTN